jgi:50S ribosomal protein L16 3-hydroxylase
MKNVIGLPALLQPFSVEQFIKEFWPDNYLVVHGLKKSTQFLLEHPQLQSVEAMVEKWSGSVTASLPDFNDEYSSIEVSSIDASKLYRNGMTLAFSNVDRQIPELGPWLNSFQEILGLPKITFSRCIVYVSPHGRGTSPHFDRNINFVLQIKGSKKWLLAPNLHCKNPLARHTMNTVLSPRLLGYTKSPMPTEMPENTTEVELRAGSLLFVPRGMWHATKAAGDSLSLNFTFGIPPWSDVLLEQLKIQLDLDERWRDYACGIGNSPNADPILKEQAEKRIAELITNLTRSVTEIKKEAFFQAPGPA